ncbi:MAG: histidine kinase [Robiginitomaculum sp.]|nr:MAG: histidine kinase [Robiginitomaculum sp.]
MALTEAMLGYGSKFEVSTDGGSTFDELLEVFNITPPSASVDTVDTTHMRSPGAKKEYILGLGDSGEASMEMHYIPGSASDLKLIAIEAARAPIMARITFPNGVTAKFNGLLTGYAPNMPNEDKMTATLTFKVSGATVVGSEVAPSNSVLPSVSGVAQVGQILTVIDGVWSGVPIFTYQWQKDAVDISGATAATYLPVVGDIGGAITVEITGANLTGSAMAESAATADVIAA